MRSALALLLVLAGVVTWSASAGADPPAGKQARRQAPPPSPTIPAKLDCRALVQDGFTSNATVPDFQDIPEAPTRIQSATIVAATATQPEYCDVRGYVQSQIKFQLKLPTTTWQGRYLQFGCGGFCGTITPTTFPACRTELGGDFAIASTNDGHDAAGTDALWAGQTEQPRIDFGYRAVHVVAVAAKAIQAAYYGRGPIKSYFQGCSDGGREGLMEAQRYPDDFDGIVAGAPALQMEFSPLFLANVIQANTGADGNPDPHARQARAAARRRGGGVRRQRRRHRQRPDRRPSGLPLRPGLDPLPGRRRPDLPDQRAGLRRAHDLRRRPRPVRAAARPADDPARLRADVGRLVGSGAAAGRARRRALGRSRPRSPSARARRAGSATRSARASR